jgi:hypothetical protein
MSADYRTKEGVGNMGTEERHVQLRIQANQRIETLIQQEGLPKHLADILVWTEIVEKVLKDPS